jgi:hypothetical protein
MLPRTFDQTATAGFFVVMLAVACLMPMQNDTWWHLRAGQEMWTRRMVMLTDEFSFSAYGAEWPNHGWGSEVLFYLLYRLGGLPLLTFFAAICVTLSLALSWRLMTGTPTQRLIVMGLALTSIVPVWTVRAHIFTLVFLPTVVHLALVRRYWPIPVIFLAWANLHAGVPLGFVALGGVALGTWYRAGLRQVWPLLAVVLASFAATCVTPMGASLWLSIPDTIGKSAANQIVEWRPPEFLSTYPAFWVTLTLLLLTTWTNRLRIDTERHAVLIAVAFALLPLALRARRNVPPFMLIAVPALTYNLAGWFARLTEHRDSRQKSAASSTLNAAVLTICVFGCASIVGLAWSSGAARLQWQPVPQQVLAEVQACGDRVYNRYADGGPLIWFAPGVRVFIDSRQDPFPLEFTRDYVAMEQTGDYQSTFRKYGIKCAMLPETSPTARRLTADGWRSRIRADGWSVLEAVSP